jgi:hypothetical protein
LSAYFCEERRQLKIVPNAFGEKPVLKLMFGALTRAAESSRGLRFTEFELRQLDAARKDLDAEYENSITRSDRPSQPQFSSKSTSISDGRLEFAAYRPIEIDTNNPITWDYSRSSGAIRGLAK